MNLSSSDLSGGGRGSPCTIFLSCLIFIFTERVQHKRSCKLKKLWTVTFCCHQRSANCTEPRVVSVKRKKFAGSLHHCGIVDRQSVCHNLEISLKRSAKKIQTSRFHHYTVRKRNLTKYDDPKAEVKLWNLGRNQCESIRFPQLTVNKKKKEQKKKLKINKCPELKCVFLGSNYAADTLHAELN